MGFNDFIGQAAGDLFAEMGQPATFIPSEGNVVDCTVVLEERTDMQPDILGQSYERITVVKGLFSEIEEPSEGERFIIGQTTYTVVDVIENDGYFVDCHVK